jgi:hypothetical protein
MGLLERADGVVQTEVQRHTVCSPVICRTSSLVGSLGSVAVAAVGSPSSAPPPPLPSRPVVSAVVGWFDDGGGGGGSPSSAGLAAVAVLIGTTGARFALLLCLR